MTLFTLLFQQELRLHRNQKVIPAQEFSTLLSAEEVVKKAEENAKTYKKKTQELRKKALEKAKKEGFDEGLSQFNQALIHFEQEIKKVRHESMQAVLPLALKAAKKIVGKELQQFPETIVDIVLQTIAPIAQNQRITIYVNKADKEVLEENRPRIREVLQQVKSLLIAEREDLAPGGCIIETETGIINASIENQWRALEAAFERYKQA